MDSRNAGVRYAYYRFCQWGQPVNVIETEPWKGGPTPVFANNFTKVQKLLSSISIIFLLVCVVELVMVLNK